MPCKLNLFLNFDLMGSEHFINYVEELSSLLSLFWFFYDFGVREREDWELALFSLCCESIPLMLAILDFVFMQQYQLRHREL